MRYIYAEKTENGVKTYEITDFGGDGEPAVIPPQKVWISKDPVATCRRLGEIINGHKCLAQPAERRRERIKTAAE